MTDQDRLVWFQGGIIPAQRAKVNALSPTAQFGINVFEGLRAYVSQDEQGLLGFRLNDHFRRLRESSALLGIDCPHSDADLLRIIRALISANQYDDDTLIRVILMIDGPGSWHSQQLPTLMVAPIQKRRQEPATWTGLHAQISSWTRIDDTSMPPRAKVGANYTNSRYGLLSARRDGYDIPIFLNRNGHVAESSGACIFILRNDTLVTPPTTDSVLESITRDTVLKIAAQLGINTLCRSIDRTEMYLADEAFICGTTVEISPVLSIDRRPVGNGLPGAIASTLMTEYIRTATTPPTGNRPWTTQLTCD